MSDKGSFAGAPKRGGTTGQGRPRRRRSRLLTLPQLLAAAVEIDPSAPAVVLGDRTLTYAELDAASSRLARALIARGLGPEQFVALGITRSIESVTATWAVAKTGAAFVPVDPNYPSDRIQHMVTDSGAALGITTGAFVAALPDSVEWLNLDDPQFAADLAALSGEPISYADRLAPVEVEHTAYVIYTSGSTGKPKGVVVTHGGLSNLSAEQRERFKIGPDSRTMHFASPSFDASVLELLLAVGAGATMVIIPPTVYGGVELAALLRRQRVTHMFITPAALASMDPADISDLQAVMVGGEHFSAELVAKWAGHAEFFNVYGPTETTILVTISNPLTPGGPMPIGEALRGVSAYVLDERLNPVPVGVAGELYLAGPAVARGYHERRALTADRFVADPFGTPGGRMYRSGDVVRRIEIDGGAQLDYVGRSDFQVKVRGFRIELGEIDAVLARHETVEFAATVGHTNDVGITSLVCYVLPREGATIDVVELKTFAGRSLPSHMVPAAIIEIDEIPLTRNGKLDRNALPEPVFEAKKFRAPATPIEEIVAGLYAELLDQDRVGADDDFFELGGNSLIATQLVARLGVALNAQIPVREVFEASSVRALAAMVESHAGAGARQPLLPRERPERIPLSLAQSRMWFLNRFDTESAVNNVPVAIRLTGPLDTVALQAAIGDVVTRHESLRTIYPDHDGAGYQLVLPADSNVPELAIEEVSPDQVVGAVTQFVTRGFDVTAEIPVRVRLYEVGPEDHVLAVVVHHISTDGSSMAPLTRDVIVAYSARVAGEIPSWTRLPVQYADYSLWQREVLGSEDDPQSLISRQLDYWRTSLADLPDELALPTDRPRPQTASNHGATYAFTIDQARLSALEDYARGLNSTLFMVMHGALAVLLARLSGSSDIAIGIPVAGRGEQALDEVVGMFVNTLVLRTRVDADTSFADLVAQSREVDLSAFANADVPFERLVEVLNPVRSQARHPLFQVALFFQNLERASLDLAGLHVAPVDFDAETARFDLQLTLSDAVSEDGQLSGMEATLNYATALFDEATVATFAQRFVRILDAVLSDGAAVVGDIDLLGEAERLAIVRGRNATDHAIERTFLLDGFDKQVAKTPGKVAVVFEGAELTYAEFDERVNKLARFLISQGVGPESLVGLGIRRSLELVVGIYAVLRAGAGYVPVDPDHPAARTTYIIEAAAPVCVLTTERDRVQFSGGHTVVHLDTLDLAGFSGDRLRAEERTAQLHPEHPAYVFFTSGSTGRPKGVTIPHRAIANQMAWMQSEYRLGPNDVYLQKTATTFDVSLWGFFMPLQVGATLVVATPDGHRDVAYVSSVIRSSAVTVTDFVPSMLAVFVSHTDPKNLVSLRDVFVIGEALPAQTAHAFAGISSAGLHNLYGPTEAAVSITSRQARIEDVGSVPIGVPQWNSNVFVLDSRLHPVPTGVPGELYLGGVQLARGYHGRVDLTSDRFVANPFGKPGERMYRTGDLVHWRPDGELDYIGRTDFQVKFRGQRIELGEIETALLADPAVLSAAVQVVAAGTGDQLVGYVTPVSGATIDADETKAGLSKSLPSYMVPTAIVVLAEFPLNPSGKLDRKALPEPTFVAKEFRAPTTPIEEIVAGLYVDVLGVERVGLDDDFFALGGNSLIATQLIARLGAALDTRVPVRDLFEAPSVEALAARVEQHAGAGRIPLVPQVRPQRIPLSLAQSRMWFLNQFDPESAAYNLPIAIRLTGTLDTAALSAAVADVVARHEVLRTLYPETNDGPAQVVLPASQAVPDLRPVPVDPGVAESAVFEFLAGAFDVTAEVPIRARLFAIGASEHILAVVIHHVSGDGSSMQPLTRDVMTAYVARARGDEPGWAPLPVQYADYALWQREVLGSEEDPDSVISRQLRFWQETLAGVPDLLELPTDRPRPAVQSFAGSRVAVELDRELHRQLVDLARSHNTTLFMLMHAAFAVLLSRLSGTDDVAVGTPFAGRGEQVLDDLIGMFVNTLVFRTEVNRGLAFTDFLARVREIDLQAFAHSDVPFERLVEVINPERSQARHPLFQVGFSFQNLTAAELALPELSVSALDTQSRTSQFDLHLIVEDYYEESGTPAGIGGVLTYATALFDEPTVQTFADRFVRLLRSVVAEPTVVVGDIELLSVAERTDLLEKWNETEHDVDSSATLVSLFDAQVAAAPAATALVSGAESLTYAEFDARVNQLARYLVSQDVGPESLVALAIRRSVDLLVAMFAVAKAGGVYVPVDPDAPAERVAYILDTASPILVLSTARDEFEAAGFASVLIDDLDLSGFDTASITDRDRTAPLLPAHTAYVIFTSGSTGRPKGVAVPHHAIVNQLLWKRTAFGLGAADAAVLKTAATFDLSVWEFWSALTSGGRLVIAEPDGHRDPTYLLALLRDQLVTTLHVVPSMLSMLMTTAGGEVSPALRHVLAIGEALPTALAQSFRADNPSTRLFNLYGPTEAAVSITTHAVSAADRTTVPIGSPQWNSRVYVLDSRLRPVPAGVAGEMYLAGAQLARGYYNHAELTADRFVADPFGGNGGRLYRTGDLVRWQSDGELEYVGRTDFQVKVRGFRIELGEIEAVVRRRAQVADVVVIARAGLGAAGEQLVGYLVPADGALIDESALAASLTGELPDYMIPVHWVVLDELPLNSNGKLDRGRLPAPVVAPKVFRAPRTHLESAIADLVGDVVGVEQVGLDDSFFALGGDSIASIQLVSRAKARGIVFGPRDVFEHKTVMDLAAVAVFAESDAILAELDGGGIGRLPLPPGARSLIASGASRSAHVAVLDLPPGIDRDGLVVVLSALLDSHDALRARVANDGESAMDVAGNGEVRADALLHRVDLATVGDGAIRSRIIAESDAAVANLDPSAGAMVRFVWFDAGTDREGRLLVAVHRLVADASSWRILLSDLTSAWLQVATGEAPRLSAEATSLRRWAYALTDIAHEPRRVAELPMWQQILAGAGQSLEVQASDDSAGLGSVATVTIPLSADVCFALLTEIPRRFHAHAADGLLAGLALAVAQSRYGATDLSTTLRLEVDTRLARLVPDADLSNTVGPFTAEFPARLDLTGLDLADAFAGGPHAGRAVKLVKEQLREIPDGGAGFGALRYFNAETAAILADLPLPAISFAWRESASEGAFRTLGLRPSADFADLADGADQGLPAPVALIARSGPDSALTLTIEYATGMIQKSDIDRLAELWQQSLSALARHAMSPGAGGLTPSDLPLVAVSQDEIDRLETQFVTLSDVWPLSPLQAGMLFHANFAADSVDVYTMQLVLDLVGDVDATRLRSAAQLLFKRHPNLRAAFVASQDGSPLQLVLDDVEVPMAEIDLTEIAEDDLDAAVAAVLEHDRSVGFDTRTAPLIRFALIRTRSAGSESGSGSKLLVTNHHIILDGWSTPLVLKDLLMLYAGGAAAAQTMPPAPSYRDYLEWLAEQDLDVARAVWNRSLNGAEPALLARDARKHETNASSNRFVVDLSQRTATALGDLASRVGVTLNTITQSAWGLVLSRAIGSEDVVFGATVSGRPPQLDHIESMVGLFINTVPVRVRVLPAESLTQLLTRLQREQADLLDHHYLSLTEIQRSAGVGELFDTITVFESFPVDAEGIAEQARELDELSVTGANSEASTHFAMVVRIHVAETIRIIFTYRTDLIDEEAARALAEKFVRVLDVAVSAPATPVSDISLIGAAERAKLIGEWGGAASGYDSGATLSSMFDEQVRRTPGATALVRGDERLTYAEFDARANRLARYLIEQGVGPEAMVGIAIRRSIDMVIGMYATVKAGGAYVPIDPDQPSDRVAFTLDVARPAVVLTTSVDGLAMRANCPVLEIDRLDLDDYSSVTVTDADRRSPLHAGNSAYAIFTSGSTGKPKGVVLAHASVVNHANWRQEMNPLDSSDAVLQKTPFTFDASVREFWWPLLFGARLVIATVDGHKDPNYLVDAISEHRITAMHFVPSMLSAFVPTARRDLIESLKLVMCGGEPLPADLVDAFLEISEAELRNEYGPTEGTVSATRSEPLHASVSMPPIGRPVPNTQVYVLDSRLQPAPIGAPGELYLAGSQLARGYVARADLTAERFVANPYDTRHGGRMYRTGDLARWLPDGTLEYIGRTDFQVKLRGLRIELGEIETVLRQHDSVQRSAVVLRNDPILGDQLVGYVVPAAGKSVDVAELSRVAGLSLPDYMVPDAIVLLDEFPLNASGKLDRKALPAPVFETQAFRPPTTPVEEIVAETFSDVLGVDRVGLDDDFFALGGNSLIAMQTLARLGRALDTRVPIHVLFDASTVGGLAARLESASKSAGRPALGAQKRPERIPLSLAQQRMWFLNRFDPSSAVNNIPMAIRLSGDLDIAALEAAVNDVVARHEILRTVYPAVDGVGQQVVLAPTAARVDLRPEPIDESEVLARAAELIAGGFDVTEAIPLRAKLFRVTDTETVLVVVIHHISSDGFSVGPLARDVMIAYAARSRGELPGWAPLPVQYADYTLWQREVLGSEADKESLLSEQISYWSERLAGIPDQLELPTDRARPVRASYLGANYLFGVESELHSRIERLAKSNGATSFMVVHAALAALLSRLSGTSDIAIGTPVAGRGESALDDLIGMFVNTLVLRIDVDISRPFAGLLAQAKDTDLAAFGHADVPFERLVEVLNPARSQARHPLFQVMLAFQNAGPSSFELPGLTLSGVEADLAVAKFDLQLTVSELFDEGGAAAGMNVTIAYATDLFDHASIVTFSQRFVRLLDAVTADPDCSIGDVDLMDAAELDRVLVSNNDTAHTVDPNATLVSLFQRAVDRTPDAIAVVFEGESLSYAEFAGRVNQLARWLMSKGVGPDTLVALGMRRSFDLVIGIYAVLTAGGGYVPLDPDHPVDRTRYILEAAAPTCVLTTRADSDTLPEGVPTVEIDALDLSGFADDDVNIDVLPGNTAYVIFTSGSTGRPKGVAVSHSAIVNRLVWMQDAYGLEPSDVVLQKTPATFDVSVWEFFWPLEVGATLVVARPDGHRDPAYLVQLIREHRITTAHFVPSMLAVFVVGENASEADTLRRVFASGEALPAATAQRLRTLTGARLHNLYGPTEAAVDVTFHEVTDADTNTVPIGAPVFNTRVYVLDSRLRPVPVGVAGELYLAGAQLARGYQGRVDLTSDRFVANPFGVGERMYRTGDLVTWTACGELDYLGRTDFQVKLRGLRIELGEVELALTALDTVEQAVAVVHSDARTGDQLVGYLVPGTGSTIDLDMVRSELAGRLPSYMVPGTFMLLDALPLNASGKLDRRALPPPVFEQTQFRAPTTPVEEIVASTFADVLGRDRVGLDDDFFALGGNSLIATQVAARVGVALNTTVAVRTMFEAPTVGAFAALVEVHAGSGGRAPLVAQQRPPIVPLSLAQQRMWFLNRFDTASAVNNVPAAIRLAGTLDVAALVGAVNDVVARHEILRTVYPEVDGAGTQVVLPIERALIDLVPVEVTEKDVPYRIAEIVGEGFDVAASVPVRATLLRISPTEHVFVVVVHHISTDGFSMGPLTRDLMLAYAARSHGEAPSWAPLPVQYADFTLWQRQVLGGEDDPESLISTQVAYWRDVLAGLPDQLGLPADRPRPAVASNRGATYRYELAADTQAALTRVAREHNATPFMVMHAALALLLARLSGTGDIAIGTPIAGRGERALDDMVGMFVNTLVLRTAVDPKASIADLIAAVRETDLQAFANADLPFERLVEVINPARSQGRHPLFQVALFFQNMSQAGLALGDLTAEALSADASIAKFDLQFAFIEAFDESGAPAGLLGSVNYATDLFDESSVARIADRLARVLAAVAADSTTTVGGIDVLFPAERDAILHARNDTRFETAGGLLLDGFAAQAAATPDAIAVVYEGESLSYGALASRVNRLARLLVETGVGPGSLVALAVRRSLDLVTGMYAVLAAGGGYVPIDPDHPADRIGYILDAADPVLVISTARDDFDAGVRSVVHIDTHDLSGYSDAPVTTHEVRPDDVAYVIFTSGSTGRPKGVAVPHAAIVNQLEWMQSEYRLTASDVYLQKTATTFDVSLWGYFMPLRIGATLVLAKPDGHREPDYLAERIRTYGVSVTDFVPSMLAVFAAAVDPQDIPTLQQVFVIGEALSAATVRDFSAISSARVHNLYGPTEAAVSITYRDVTDTAKAGAVPIGVPQWNSQVFVLDGMLSPVPAGVPGELYLAGVQLARGYHGRADLTSDRFVASPFGKGTRMYRTGDLVRWSADSELEYIGRTDFQVKFRGQRIELGEIETALQAHVAVLGAAAAVLSTSTGDQLVGYAVATPGANVDAAQLRSFLGQTLPSYMVPGTILVLDEFPLNASGKLDRKALPAPVFETRSFRAPATPVEEIIANTFADVLGVERVGADDDFFALGGNSLVATQVAARLGAAIDRRVPVRMLFEAPTVHALAAQIEAHAGAGGLVALVPQHRPEVIPLSLAQQRMWFLNRFDTSAAVYNIPAVIRLTGTLDTVALRNAVNDVIARHEVLRTVYPEVDGSGVQQILPLAQARIDLVPEDVGAAQVVERATRLVTTGFDVTAAVPLRVRLLRVDDTDHVLVVVVHHIAADGFSMTPLTRDVMVAYAARAQGEAPAWAPLPVQYADFALWQRSVLGSEDDPGSLMSQQIDYWRRSLTGAPDRIDLPADRQRPAVASNRGARHGVRLDAGLQVSIERLAREKAATPFMVVHAALAVLLAKLTGGRDICIGTPVAGRGEQALDELVGMFVNTLVLRTDVDPAGTFATLLDRVRETDLAAFGHADVPFERLVEVLAPERSTARHPLFQVALAFQNLATAALKLGDLSVEGLAADVDTARFDLQFTVAETFDAAGVPAGIDLSISYATDLFDAERIATFADQFTRVLHAVTAQSETTVGDLDLLDETQRASLLAVQSVGSAHSRHAWTMTLPQLLATAVERNPSGVAVVDQERTITYRELDERSSRLARVLIGYGVGTEDLIAIAIPRSLESILALWAVAKTGGAFLPVDANYPVDRVEHMITDSGAVLGLTLTAHASRLPGSARWLVLDDTEFAAEIDAAPGDAVTYVDRRAPMRAEQAAYVIYTSGSTGKPKGVVLTHAGLLNFCMEQYERYELTESSRALHFASPSFDASILELLLAIGAGAALVISPPFVYGGAELAELIRRERVTHSFLTPSVLASLDPAGLDEFQYVVAGGEAIGSELVARWAPGRKLFNGYGPTETTIMTNISAPMTAGERVTIGPPIRNMRSIVLDGRLRPVPVGVSGELYLSGVQLARGYHNRSALTAGRFVANPYGEPGERMYRTGDVVAWTAAGEIAYVGRSDFQVKVRGFRIELGEIDAALTAHHDVDFAVTVAHESISGATQLASYVLPSTGGSLDVDALREFAGQALPAHMVPASIMLLDAIPLTPVGKLDRDALPVPVFEAATFRAPQTPMQTAVATAFGEILGVERIGLDDDFFSLGGHSLLVVKVAARLRELTGSEVAVQQLFDHSRVEDLAKLMDPAQQSAAVAGFEAYVALADDITAARADAPATVTPSRVLLTGATGFLGSHLVRELLEQTDAKVYCLVRASSPEHGLQRIEESMRRFGAWGDGAGSSRIIAVPGDLDADGLGLSDSQMVELAAQIDTIVHNGARVNHIETYSRLHRPNVLATESLLRLAVTGRLKPVHFVSTGSVLTDTQDRSRVVGEDELPEAERIPKSGYVQSKWVGEQLVRIARERGIPVSVYRPGLITGDTATGAGGTDDAFWNMVRAIAALGLIPDVAESGSVAMVPVNYVAKALVRIATAGSAGGNYNLVARHRVEMAELRRQLEAHGFDLRLVGVEEFGSKLFGTAEDLSVAGDDTLMRAALVAGQFADGLAEDAFGDENTRAALAGSGIEPPVVDAEILGRYIEYYARIGFLQRLG